MGLALGAALIVAVVAYSPARSMSFYHDDRATILNNEKIQSPSLITVLSENPFRAVVNVTFAVQHRLHSPELPRSPLALPGAGALISKSHTPDGRLLAVYTSPVNGEAVPVSIDRERGLVFPLPPALPFRAFNLAVHIINAGILFLVLGRVTRSPLLGAVASAAFLFHPLTTETVNYITARFSLLAATFSLLAVYFHLRSFDKPIHGASAVVFFILALFSKETAVVLPLIIFLLDLARDRPRARILLWLVLSGIYMALRSQWLIVLGNPAQSLLPWPQYLLLQQRVFWLYLIKILWPVHQSFDYHIVPRAALDIFFATINTALLTASGYIIAKRFLSLRSLRGPDTAVAQKSGSKKAKKKKSIANESGPPPVSADPAVWICTIILMCWIALLPTSSVIPLGDIAREDRVYFMLAIVIPALLAGPLINFGDRAFRVPTASCIALILLLLLPLTFNRNRVWTSELSINRDTFTKSPEKRRAVYNYATALKWSDRIVPALHWYEHALKMDQDNLNTIINVRTLRKLVEEEKKAGGQKR